MRKSVLASLGVLLILERCCFMRLITANVHPPSCLEEGARPVANSSHFEALALIPHLVCGSFDCFAF